MAFRNLNKKLDDLDYKTQKSKKSRKKFMFKLFVIILLLVGFFGFFIKQTVDASKQLKAHGINLVQAYKAQNFDQMKSELKATKDALETVNGSLMVFFWVEWIPLAGGYYGDGKSFIEAGIEELKAAEVLLTELEPHKDELMFKNTPLSGPDRVVQGVKILQKSLPIMDKVQPHLDKAADEVRNIDANKYPDEYRGVKVKSLAQAGKNFIVGISDTVKNHKDALEVAPAALGTDTPKNYLLLFQNDKEIRATGGFLTAYATLKIDKGSLSPTHSDDIYRLDEQLLNACLNVICPLTPPEPIARYLPEPDGKPRKAWSLRDSNLSPDVPTSAAKFEEMFKFLGQGVPFDGIIYIDTQVVEEIIGVTGPIEVLGTKYSADIDDRCNCPNVVFELERYAEVIEKGEADRKAILGVLMQQIMARALGTEIENTPQLVDTIIRLANHKHIIFYMHDDKTQQALSKLNWIGEIKQYDGDYLHVNDSNFAGGKSNLYVNQEVNYEVDIKDGIAKKKLTIKYINPRPFNIWLNGINRDYVRVYVPQGSKLTSSKGSEVKVRAAEELGKTYFDGFVVVRPENSREYTLEYETPYNQEDEYKLMIQKQPGAKDFKYKIKLNGKQVEEFELDMDKDFKFKL